MSRASKAAGWSFAAGAGRQSRLFVTNSKSSRTVFGQAEKCPAEPAPLVTIQ